MIPTTNPKTIARRKAMKLKYADYKLESINVGNHNQYNIVHSSEIDLSSYHTIENHTIIISYENDIEGLYCDNPKFLYRNSNDKDEHITCLDIYWNCNDCMTCDKRRRLHIMKQIDKRFRYHTGINEFHKISFALIDDDTPSKVAKRLKYINGKNNLLMWVIPNTNQNRIEFVCEGGGANPLSKEDVLNLVQVRDKYRFLGKWYNKVPDVEFAGMTKEEIYELKKVKAVPKDRCGCGELISDHTIRAAKNSYDFDVNVEAEEFYEEEHIKFKKKYIN